MFLDELSPIFQELTRQPLAFMGGFVSGLLRLNLSDDPVRSWLNRQSGITDDITTTPVQNGKASGPQSIQID
jgi:hypothetical protein